MSVKNALTEGLEKAVQALYPGKLSGEEVPLAATGRGFQGEYSFALFHAASRLGQPPAEVARAIGDWMSKHDHLVASYEVVKGFLNLTLTDNAWKEGLEELQTYLHTPPTPSGKNFVVEFSCPNTNKPLHLGHFRNNCLGESLAKILQAAGHTVTKVNLINDRGIHICKSMLAYQKRGQGHTPAATGKKGDHFVGDYYVLFDKLYQEELAALHPGKGDIKKGELTPLLQEAGQMLEEWEQGDPATLQLWRQMNAWVYEGFDQTYQATGVSFDKVYYESDTYLKGKELVQEGLAAGVFRQRPDGSVWVGLEEEGLGEKLVLRANGTSVYITQDLGTIEQRYQDFPFDTHIYVVGNEQEYHFQVLFSILQKLQKPYAGRLFHLSYGMVTLPSGKMKSREGSTVGIDELLEEMLAYARQQTEALGKCDGMGEDELAQLYKILGLGAMKYFFLKVTAAKNLLFNPAASIDFRGDTASFIQYTYARVCALLRKAQERGLAVAEQPAAEHPFEAEERKLLYWLVGFPAIVERAAATYNPALIAEYVYELAKAYNHFYASTPVLQATPSLCKQRLLLSRTTGMMIQKAMALLGIDVPERM